jgi:hypothetical protein
MVRYYVRRYLHGLKARSPWLLLILLPPLTYLIFAALRADRFVVKQDVGISRDAPIALSTSPVDFAKMSDFLAQPAEFFSDRFAVRELYGQLYPGTILDQTSPQFGPLLSAVERHMLMISPSDKLVRIMYRGADPALGAKLVEFYAKRLIKKSEDGLKRSKAQLAKGPPALGQEASVTAQLRGGPGKEAQRALWRRGRLPTLLKLTIVSVLVVLVLIGALEWADASFKSVRQVARYLNVPVLGALPDLNRVSKTLSASPRG